MPGRRLLARRLLQCLHQFAENGVASPPTPGAAITRSMAAADGSCGSPARVPVMLQHDSYSEAVKAQLSASTAPATPPTPPPQPLPSTTALPASPPAPATPPTPPPQPLPSTTALPASPPVPATPPTSPPQPLPSTTALPASPPAPVVHISQSFLVGTPLQVPIQI
ncbi:vegetative cell wall protein gp1-like [Homalodisca vitripennis]|uniref:vegetative cell wall protein gp1-like n=1 Tax=Homalodisca vitripennis TaxID=197043 RepID=UPI001EEB4F24|nr:vegetative cell wall protein gp1-like [Homalodisca vitripennis]